MPLLDENQRHNYGGGHVRAPIESLKKVFAAVVYTGTQHGGSAPSPHTCDPSMLVSFSRWSPRSSSESDPGRNYQRTKFYVHGGLVTVTVSG